MRRVFLHQIFYDKRTKRMLDPGFIALDNTANERPDWFEFWVIRNFLLTTPLKEDALYGFLSPRFREKTGLEGRTVKRFLDNVADHVDVALFPHRWDQIAYFLNPFEQGEFNHPGLLGLSQDFLARVGMNIDLQTLVTHSLTTVFSNYFVASPLFWRRWLELANALFDHVEAGGDALSSAIGTGTSHGSELRQTPMKTFIQERFCSLLLATGRFRVAALDMGDRAPMSPHMFPMDPHTRRLLLACDTLKQEYRASGDGDYLAMYRKLRGKIPLLAARASNTA